ncbi:CBU_0592 family membrane protein [Actinocorallia longicatena]|uniref:CBU-0592-like domain-containing protein n=1 Tax=Actinocorallia longicatena TaxID=111803 RepID=A0ABP6Q443_9ACTN
MTDFTQIGGALLILTAYMTAQAKVLDQDSYLYHVLNVTGSTVLTCLALTGREWGFLLLQGSWALVTAMSLAFRYRRKWLDDRGMLDFDPVRWEDRPVSESALGLPPEDAV